MYFLDITDEEVDAELKKMNMGELSAAEKDMAHGAMKSEIAWQILVARTIVPNIEVTKEEIETEKYNFIDDIHNGIARVENNNYEISYIYPNGEFITDKWYFSYPRQTGSIAVCSLN